MSPTRFRQDCKGVSMPRTRPPRLATWLLKRFGKESTTEAILGDLTERFETGKSRSWYWKQVAIAAVACARCDLQAYAFGAAIALILSLIHISEPTRLLSISYAV